LLQSCGQPHALIVGAAAGQHRIQVRDSKRWLGAGVTQVGGRYWLSPSSHRCCDSLMAAASNPSLAVNPVRLRAGATDDNTTPNRARCAAAPGVHQPGRQFRILAAQPVKASL